MTWRVLTGAAEHVDIIEYWPVLCVSQVMRTVRGIAAWPTSAERCSSKPSITCWSAASWTDPSFVSASGSSNPTRRMRSLSTKGKRDVAQTEAAVYVLAITWWVFMPSDADACRKHLTAWSSLLTSDIRLLAFLCEEEPLLWKPAILSRNLPGCSVCLHESCTRACRHPNEVPVLSETFK